MADTPQATVTAPPPPQIDTQNPPIQGDLQQPQPAQPAQPAQPSPASNAPAQAPASDAGATPRVHGVLGRIVLGALKEVAKGADVAARATGREVRTFGQNSPQGLRIQENARANAAAKLDAQQKQQSMKIQQQEEQRAEAQESREEQDWGIKHNALSTAQAHVAFTDQVEEQKDIADISNQNSQLDSQLRALGIKPKFDNHSFDQLGPTQAKGIADGSLTPISIGGKGDAAGLHLYSTRDLVGTPLAEDAQIKVDYHVDPKTGELKSNRTVTLPAGTSAYDAWVLATSEIQKGQIELGQFNQKQQAQEQQAKTAQEQAEAAQKREAAALSAEQIKQMRQLGTSVPDGYVPDPSNFTLSATQLQSKLAQQGVKVPGNFQALYGMAHYDVDPNTFPSRPYNRPGMPLQMSKAQAEDAIRAFVNPNYDEKNYTAVKDMEKEFASTKQNTAGGSLIAFNTAIGHAYQLYQASQALQNGDVPALNRIAVQLGLQTGNAAPVVFDAIKTALVGEIGKTFKGAAPDVPEMQEIATTLNTAQSPDQIRGAIIGAYGHLLETKAGNVIQHYVDYTGHLPPSTFSPTTVTALRGMGLDPAAVLPGGATVAQGGTANPNPQGGGQPQIPAGATPVTVNGKTVGYRTDTTPAGQMIPLNQ